MKKNKTNSLFLLSLAFVLACSKEEDKNFTSDQYKKEFSSNDSNNLSKPRLKPEDEEKSKGEPHKKNDEGKKKVYSVEEFQEKNQGNQAEKVSKKEEENSILNSLVFSKKRENEQKLQILSILVEEVRKTGVFKSTSNDYLNNWVFRDPRGLKFGETTFQVLYILASYQGVSFLSESKNQIYKLFKSLHKCGTSYSDLYLDFYKYVKEEINSLNQNNASANYAQNLDEFIKKIEEVEKKITETVLKNPNAKNTKFILDYINPDIKLVFDSFDLLLYYLVANYFLGRNFSLDELNKKSTKELEDLFEKIHYDIFCTDLSNDLLPNLNKKNQTIFFQVEKWGLVNVFYLMKDIKENINALNQEFNYGILSWLINNIIFLENFHFDETMTLLIEQGIIKKSNSGDIEPSINEFKDSLKKLRENLGMSRALYL